MTEPEALRELATLAETIDDDLMRVFLTTVIAPVLRIIADRYDRE